MKQPPIEMTNEQVGQELDMWFNNEECEALARETGFIQRSTSRLTGRGFFNLLTAETLDEPTISYEGLCDILEERNPNLQITPPEVYRKRQKAAIKAAKRKGRGISLSYLKFLKYTFYITNVPATLWPMEAVGTVYRLRWQVELVFKNWKSLLLINVLKGARPERIRCLIYGRLIVILVVQRLLALASAQAVNEQREHSFCKVSQWLMRGGRLLKAFLDRQFGGLPRRMLSRLKRLLKQKRKRLTTWHTIAQQVPDLGHFVQEEPSSAGCA